VSETASLSQADAAAISAKIVASSHALQEALTKSSTDIVSAVNTSPGSKLHEMFQQWTAAAGELAELGKRLQHPDETVAQLRETQAALSGMATGIAEETKKLIAALETERSLSRQEA